MHEHVRLQYKRKYPLDLVISDQCLDKYNAIFFFLLRLKRINHILSHMWKYLSSSDFRVIFFPLIFQRLPTYSYTKLRRVQLLRSNMQHFITMLEQYVLTEVI